MSKILKNLIGNAAVVSMFLVGTAEFVANVDMAEASRGYDADDSGIEMDESQDKSINKKLIEYFGKDSDGLSFDRWGYGSAKGKGDFIVFISYAISTNPGDKILDGFELIEDRNKFENIEKGNLEENVYEGRKKLEEKKRQRFLRSRECLRVYLANAIEKLPESQRKEELNRKLIEESTAIFASEYDIVSRDADELNRKLREYFGAIKSLIELLIQNIKGQ